MRTFYFIISVFILFSCKKSDFTHTDETFTFPCSCCVIADSIEGSYEGVLTTISYEGFWGGSPQFDTVVDSSITFDVTRTWDSSNYLEDSLICKFLVPVFFSEPLLFTDNSGSFAPKEYMTQNFSLEGELYLFYTDYISELAYSYPAYTMNAVKQ